MIQFIEKAKSFSKFKLQKKNNSSNMDDSSNKEIVDKMGEGMKFHRNGEAG